MSLDDVDRSPADALRSVLITGAAVVIPVIITLVVLDVVVGFLYAQLSFLVDLLLWAGIGGDSTESFVRFGAPGVLVGIVVVVGLAVDRSRLGERAVDYMDAVIVRIPGVGSLYGGFRQMTDVVMESDVENFRDVKIVEFPQSDTYTLGFVTTRTPTEIADPTPHDEMWTLFLPLAPNPVMGGHLVHVPDERVLDVDLTVEEGMSAVVTTGVAAADATAASGLSPEELERLAGVDPATGEGDAA